MPITLRTNGAITITANISIARSRPSTKKLRRITGGVFVLIDTLKRLIALRTTRSRLLAGRTRRGRTPAAALVFLLVRTITEPGAATALHSDVVLDLLHTGARFYNIFSPAFRFTIFHFARKRHRAALDLNLNVRGVKIVIV